MVLEFEIHITIDLEKQMKKNLKKQEYRRKVV